MRKTRAKRVWDDTMLLWGDKKWGAIVAKRFGSPRRMYRNMKRAWNRSRKDYLGTVALAGT